MSADSQGNDVASVAVPVTGNLGIAPAGTTLPTSAAGGASDFVLPVAFVKAGLLKVDGGPQWAWAAAGDAIEFWQEGYSIPSGLADVTLVATFAQTDNFIRSVIYGRTPDVNGFVIVDGGGHSTQYVLFTEEIFKNGVIRRRIAAVAQVQSVAEDKSTRGEVLGYVVTFSIKISPLLQNGHFGEWLLPAPSAVVSTISAATPSAAAAGVEVTITGTGFNGATLVKFGATNAAAFSVVSSTSIKAIMPPGAAGTANITVTTPAGVSSAFAYTRGA